MAAPERSLESILPALPAEVNPCCRVEIVIDAQGNEVMTTVMDGIPFALACGGLLLIIVLSHFMIRLARRKPDDAKGWRFNLLSAGWVKRLVKLRYFPLIMQGASILVFAGVIYAGLAGSQRTNIAPVVTWTLWWAMLIFFVAMFGKLFCMICPWEGVASIVSSLSFGSRKRRLGYGLKWPKGLRNIYPALFLFMLLTWFELGHDVTGSPRMTAVLALIYVLMAVVCALVFERRAFCRYVCLVGRVQGIYALFSPVELRPDSADVCRSCANKDCYNGNETATGCPTHLFPGSLSENTYCTLCTECVRACPHDNLQLNVRPPATDLMKKVRFRWDEAVMCIVLLALTVFHGVTMTPVWNRLVGLIRVNLDVGYVAVFTVLMAAMILLPVGIFYVTALVARRVTQVPNVGVASIFKAFAYSVVPVALFYHLAHNSMHFFMEAQHVVPLLSDPLGRGWDLFGTAGKEYGELMSMNAIWWMQIILIVIGHVYSVVVAERTSRHLFKDRRAAARSLVPLILTMILYSAVSVWLIAQPMEMRSGM